MTGKRRRTQLNYRSIKRCNLTNKVIRLANAGTQTSPTLIVGRLYVDVERLEDRIIQGQSKDKHVAPRRDSTEDIQHQTASVLEATEKDDEFLCNSLRLSLETSEDNKIFNNYEQKEVLYTSPEEPAPNDSKLQMARPTPNDLDSSVIHSISSSSSFASSEGELQVNHVNENKATVRNSLTSISDENKIMHVDELYLNDAPIVISRSNRIASSSSSEYTEEEDGEEGGDNDNEGNHRDTENKKRNKYIRISAQTVHIHNHFYKH